MRDDRFPIPEERAERAEALFSKLSNYFQTYVPQFKGDGWAVASWEDIHELCALFREIIALKFSPDCDGDTSVEIYAVPRHLGRMHAFFEPYAPDTMARRGDKESPPSSSAWTNYVEELLRLSSYMVSVGSGIAKAELVRIYLKNAEDQRVREQLYQTYLDKVQTARQLIDAGHREAALILIADARKIRGDDDKHEADFLYVELHKIEFNAACTAIRQVIRDGADLQVGRDLFSAASREFGRAPMEPVRVEWLKHVNARRQNTQKAN